MSSEQVRAIDEDLVARARAGDRRAFEELVRTHERGVFTLALRLVGDRQLAEDVSQEAFVRAWRALPRFRGDAKFSTWMHRITVNAAWTQRRRARRHDADSLDFLLWEPRDEGIDPQRQVESSDAGRELLRALDSLPPAQRVVIVLKDVHDWSHAEIASHLGITVTAAKVRLHRARARLRATLEARGSGGPS